MWRSSKVMLCVAASTAARDKSGGAEQNKSSSSSSSSKKVDLEAMSTEKRAFLRAMMDKDDELFQLKRLHEISCNRVEEVHRRAINDKEKHAAWMDGSHANQSLMQAACFQYTESNVRGHMAEWYKRRVIRAFQYCCYGMFFQVWMYWHYAMDEDRHYQKEIPQVLWNADSIDHLTRKPVDVFKDARENQKKEQEEEKRAKQEQEKQAKQAA